MDNSVYVSVTRLRSLTNLIDITASNIANMASTGFKKEGALFSEFVKKADVEGGSISMADARVRTTDLSQGELSLTGGVYDLAIVGDGFFRIMTPSGEALTRAGAFSRNADGELVTADGHRVLDEGGAPIFVSPEARSISVAPNGTISADGAPVAVIGVVRPTDPTKLERLHGSLFVSDSGTEPAGDFSIHQGYIEKSNVQPVLEMANMVKIQRAYELGQSLMDAEDERIRSAVRTLGAQS
ncbi:flagellar hook-basal body complex protein [Oceanicella actignis]|uniref:Flagellar basal-body rod protein FlgF n=1 Tax=Oceanicella actignis TaxID=1189325 RepID=A0A1M7T6B0_9RHOB|nr:flagellar hook-basal body complex protein [Oceanicella actignis]SET44385.1 flagellar basal-body rod protein FlgF [Oceanicella actignis]SHN66236.1 flagellar basal-body rod protein FlgF [Oceanicella actignis]